MIRIHPFGDYAHRQPLAYPAIRAACAGRIEVVDDIARAEIVTVSHTKDLDRHAEVLKARIGPDQRLVLLSEEPFWDTVWDPDPLAREGTRETSRGPLRFTRLTHLTSDIYRFDRIPYFLLTDPAYARRYAGLFARNAARGAERWRALWAAAPWQAGFMAEARDDPKYDRGFPQAGVAGLSSRRTRIARACGKRSLRLGHGWQPGPRRQALRDWHLDKLVRLDGQCRLFSAIENTLHPDYVTEKPFDALAMGAVPLVEAGLGHRLHALFPEGGLLDLKGLPPAEAAAAIDDWDPATADPAPYMAAQRRMAALFADPAILRAEYDRLAQALEAALAGVCDSPAPALSPAG